MESYDHRPTTVQYPPDTPEHEAYAAELRTELGKFARGEEPYPYEAPFPHLCRVPDLTTLRALLRRMRAAGWEHVRYGRDDWHEDVWRREIREGGRLVTQQISVYGCTVEMKRNRESQASVTVSRTWDTDFDLAQLAEIAETLGLLPRVGHADCGCPLDVEAGQIEHHRLTCWRAWSFGSFDFRAAGPEG